MHKGPFDSGVWTEEELLPKRRRAKNCPGSRAGNEKKVRQERRLIPALSGQGPFRAPCPWHPLQKRKTCTSRKKCTDTSDGRCSYEDEASENASCEPVIRPGQAVFIMTT